jgi:hypothetical protein
MIYSLTRVEFNDSLMGFKNSAKTKSKGAPNDGFNFSSNTLPLSLKYIR